MYRPVITSLNHVTDYLSLPLSHPLCFTVLALIKEVALSALVNVLFVEMAGSVYFFITTVVLYFGPDKFLPNLTQSNPPTVDAPCGKISGSHLKTRYGRQIAAFRGTTTYSICVCGLFTKGVIKYKCGLNKCRKANAK